MNILLKADKNRFTLFPIKYKNAYEGYKKHITTFWTVEEIPFDKDIESWRNMSNNSKHYIKYILAFFSSFDGIVNENLAINFYNEIQIPEYRAFLSVQIAMETIHNEAYSMMIDTYADNAEEKNKLLNLRIPLRFCFTSKKISL